MTSINFSLSLSVVSSGITCPAVVGRTMASLSEVLTSAGVQETFSDKLVEDGWTVEHFALAAHNLESFELELKDSSTTISVEISMDSMSIFNHSCFEL